MDFSYKGTTKTLDDIQIVRAIADLEETVTLPKLLNMVSPESFKPTSFAFAYSSFLTAVGFSPCVVSIAKEMAAGEGLEEAAKQMIDLFSVIYPELKNNNKDSTAETKNNNKDSTAETKKKPATRKRATRKTKK